MLHALPTVTFCAALLVLGGCSKQAVNSTPPLKPSATADSASPVAAGSTADTSVPPAASVLTPAKEAKLDATAGRTNKPMTKAQESSAMPLPGQNNDHSAPLSPAKGASAP